MLGAGVTLVFDETTKADIWALLSLAPPYPTSLIAVALVLNASNSAPAYVGSPWSVLAPMSTHRFAVSDACAPPTRWAPVRAVVVVSGLNELLCINTFSLAEPLLASAKKQSPV